MTEYVHGPLTEEQSRELRGLWSPETKARMEAAMSHLLKDESGSTDEKTTSAHSSAEVARELGIRLPELPPRTDV